MFGLFRRRQPPAQNGAPPAEQRSPWRDHDGTINWSRGFTGAAALFLGGPAAAQAAMNANNRIEDYRHARSQPNLGLSPAMPSRTPADGNHWGSIQDLTPQFSPLNYMGGSQPQGMTIEQMEAQSEARVAAAMQARIEAARNGQAQAPEAPNTQSNRHRLNLNMDSMSGATHAAMLAMAQQRAAGIGTGQAR